MGYRRGVPGVGESSLEPIAGKYIHQGLYHRASKNQFMNVQLMISNAWILNTQMTDFPCSALLALITFFPCPFFLSCLVSRVDPAH